MGVCVQGSTSRDVLLYGKDIPGFFLCIKSCSMNSMVNSLIVNWMVSTVAVGITSFLLPGVAVAGVVSALVFALVLGVVNAFVRPVVFLLTLPLNIMTLGLLTFVINALLVWLAAGLVPGFVIAGFWSALFFSLVLSFVNIGLHVMSRDK